jgi:hypothetical protein
MANLGLSFMSEVTMTSADLFESEQQRSSDFFVHAINLTFLLLQVLDKLRGSPYDQRELKQRLNMLMPLLEKLSNQHLDMLARHNPHHRLYKLQEDMEGLLEEIALHKTDMYPVLAGIFKMFREDPDKVLKALDIQLRLPEH